MKACSTLLAIMLVAYGSLAEAQFSAQLQGTVLDQTRRRRARRRGDARQRRDRRLAGDRVGCQRRLPFPEPARQAPTRSRWRWPGFKTRTVDAQVLTQQTANIAVALEVGIRARKW